MDIYHSFRGYVRIELTSADITAVLDEVSRKGIAVHNVEITGELTARLTVSRNDLKRIEIMTNKNGDKIERISRIGIFWPLWDLRQRPVLILTLLLILFLTYFTPSRILFVEIEGNKTVPEKLILEAAENAGICIGAPRREIRSEKVKNTLLDLLPQLQWAGVNTYGCRAVISVRERALETEKRVAEAGTRIIACYDGVITACTVTEGNPMCHVGQAVVKGQLLISGYTDCGGVAVCGHAEGEVFASTRQEIDAVMPLEQMKRGDITEVKTKYSLCIGKKRINLYKGSGISDATCVKMVTQYSLARVGDYTLPIVLTKESIITAQIHPALSESAEAAETLTHGVREYLRRDGIARSIIDMKEALETEENLLGLVGTYNCVEMIGREQKEEIGDFHGKTD